MIIAVGTDIVEIARIEKALQHHGRKFAERILCPGELARFDESAHPPAYLAKRFAAKEALSKALGTGIGAVSWQDMETVNSVKGRPEFNLSTTAQQVMSDLGADEVLLSLSDEKHYAVAFVVLSKRI